jgi:predicted RNA polymerase sigma factor
MPTPNPMVSLNRAVAVAMVHGPIAALAILDELTGDDRVARHHRLAAVRGHVLEMAGRTDEALEAARLTRTRPERDHLRQRAAELGG